MARRREYMNYSMNQMTACRLCPRGCGVDRKNGQTGRCGVTASLKAARASLHMWEEPCISGKEGSGTVFFSGCSLKCVYCQNREIALGHAGTRISEQRLADIFLELQERHANNINLVTAGHYIPQVITALDLARSQGLSVPIVYNSSGYETVEALRLLEGYIDIYLPDFKYMDAQLAERYSHAPDYPYVAQAAIAEMYRQAGPPEFSETGMMKRGMIVRHLLLPGHVKNAKAVVQYLYETYEDNIYISLMDQYTPLDADRVGRTDPLLTRRVTKREYNRLLEFVMHLGVTHAFIQDGSVAEESFIPAFDGEGILPEQ